MNQGGFSHLYAYTGFPRSLNALNELKKVLQSNCDAEWKEGKLWVRPLVWENAQQAYELGVKNQTLMEEVHSHTISVHRVTFI